MFAVADADAAFERALELGARVVTPLFDTAYTTGGVVEDPQGALLTLSQYRPPEEG
jgi:predicted enzyme related to lactoylglutathione lyase